MRNHHVNDILNQLESAGVQYCFGVLNLTYLYVWKYFGENIALGSSCLRHCLFESTLGRTLLWGPHLVVLARSEAEF